MSNGRKLPVTPAPLMLLIMVSSTKTSHPMNRILTFPITLKVLKLDISSSHAHHLHGFLLRLLSHNLHVRQRGATIDGAEYIRFLLSHFQLSRKIAIFPPRTLAHNDFFSPLLGTLYGNFYI